MKISIINISDYPAIISTEEENKWLSFLNINNFSVCKSNLDIQLSNITDLNLLLKSDFYELILFSSGWFNAINNTNLINKQIGNWKKIIIWFSDTLHIQAIFYNDNNVYNIYGITLRNIYELNKIEKEVLINFIEKQVFQTYLIEDFSKQAIILGRLHWWHLMILLTVIDLYWIEIFEWDILYLEFHWIEEYFIYYYLDVLKNKWIFNKIWWIILDKEIDNINKLKLIKYFCDNWINNIYSLWKISFLPFYKNVIIENWKLILNI